jgi:hypothetical protein
MPTKESPAFPAKPWEQTTLLFSLDGQGRWKNSFSKKKKVKMHTKFKSQTSTRPLAAFVLLDVDAVGVCVVSVCKTAQWLLDVPILAQF